MINTKPNFLIVGAAKTGTTSLFHYLNSHSEIFIPDRKECRFFSEMPGNFKGIGADYQNDTIKSFEEYQKLFEPGFSQKARGDISNDYLFYHEKSIKNIKNFLGNEVKIIITLRNPIERAYSNYLHHVNAGWEKLTFEEALIAEPFRKIENWAWPWLYVETGMYYLQVKAYLDSFPNVKVLLYEDIKDMQRCLTDLFMYLDVDANINIDTSKVYHKAGKPLSFFLNKIIKEENTVKTLFRPIVKSISSSKLRENVKGKIINLNKIDQKIPMNKVTRIYLIDRFKEDIKKLEKLIGKDLGQWLQN